MTAQPSIPKYIVVRGGVRKMNPEYIALWESYLDEGMSAKHVGEIFGVHNDTVRKYYPDKVWSYDQARELALMTRQHNRAMQKVTYV